MSGEQPFSTIGVSLPEEATVVAAYRLERFRLVNSLSDVDRMIEGTLPAITHSASLEAADLIGGALRYWKRRPGRGIPMEIIVFVTFLERLGNRV